MKQIALDIGLAPEPTLAGYLAGRNAQALQHLRLWAEGATRSPVPTYLWGAEGTGKTHLLRAARQALQAQGAKVGWLDLAVPARTAFDEAWDAVLMDEVHRYGAEHQHTAFNWFVNAVSPADGRPRAVLAAGDDPPHHPRTPPGRRLPARQESSPPARRPLPALPVARMPSRRRPLRSGPHDPVGTRRRDVRGEPRTAVQGTPHPHARVTRAGHPPRRRHPRVRLSHPEAIPVQRPTDRDRARRRDPAGRDCSTRAPTPAIRRRSDARPTAPSSLSACGVRVPGRSGAAARRRRAVRCARARS